MTKNILNKNDLTTSIQEGRSQSQLIGSKISRLQETGLYFKNKIKQENAQLQQLEKEIKDAEENLVNLRKQLMEQRKSNREKDDTKLHVTEQNDPNILNTKITSIKRKINTQNVKLNESISKNRDLKNEVNRLREEKEICEQVLQKLHADLQKNKQNLLAAKNDRDEIKRLKHESISQLKSLQINRSRQKREYEREFNDVFKQLDQENRDQRLKERGYKKSRGDFIGEDSQEMDIFDDFDESPVQGFSTFEGFGRQKTGEKHKFKHHEKEITQQEINREKKMVEEYQAVYENLKQETNSSNMDEIVQKFQDYQDENNKLFTYITTITDEYETLNKERINLEQELNQLLNVDQNQVNDPKSRKFKELSREIATVQTKRHRYEKEYSKLKQIINELKISIPIMFDRIGCNSEEYTKELDSVQNQDMTNRANDDNEGRKQPNNDYIQTQIQQGISEAQQKIDKNLKPEDNKYFSQDDKKQYQEDRLNPEDFVKHARDTIQQQINQKAAKNTKKK
ncbi:hypothetical protein PPERSA_13151 [Pseudocohnilembus persalinus]|uniref:ODAD1 central coiled coil region domain-containing protein n=1 Tax=Pseudocohnilembus persalinus TaxID=266149 RepID=A0A0V0QBG2_PSEPJ|nr:hypothetical protein PPERSA_13151 [Pseudocohnilembus persalinus]|eukprot:KRW99571.1 hypothetical protein PPERSA_13151 [Pseudocohnilembus persalinus]